MRKVVFIGASLVLSASLILNGYLLTNSRLGDRPLTPQDSQWVFQALRHRAEQERVPVDTMRRLNQAAVVHFKEQVCVGLSPSAGVAGGRSVVCFDETTRRIVRSEIVGE